MKKSLLIFLFFITGCTQVSNQVTREGLNLTIADVSLHDSSSDCWIVVNEQVYDVTEWVPQHPGKEVIIQGCGTNATYLFENRPMGSGTAHSGRARALLDSYWIGEIKEE